ncbi:paeninodin family lasso peptide [Jeotgalibacillus sp. S-D1]|nr:paeninodin family lasso peptide [Jeotgalibacillus sp. S-D1]TDL31832.1 paeninodin family lasso peptide [Jeotgalibacillus sp. S-D1]
MKMEWKAPVLEVLEVEKTMKGWTTPKPPKEPGDKEEPGLLDS